MAPRNSLLLGQIALDLGVLSPEKLQECLVLQAGQVRPRPLGTLLLENGFLTEGDLGLVMQEQARRLRETVPYAEGQREEVSFGRLLVKAGFTTLERVNEALRAQQDLAERGVRKRLGELLVEAGHIAPEVVQAVLRMQGKVLMACTFCGAHFNVVESLADRYPCRKCDMPLGQTVAVVSAEDSCYLLPAVAATVPAAAPAPPAAARVEAAAVAAAVVAAPVTEGSGVGRRVALLLTFLATLALVLLLLTESSAV
jgi:hypothetical protein